MISPVDFVGLLKEKKFRFFTGVPCSFFQSAINCVGDDKTLRYVIAANEGSALALASGAYLGGELPVVMIQNSGLGNLINPLTSLNMIYGLPALIFVSGRAYDVPDEPQHEIIGKTMGGLLTAMGISYSDFPASAQECERALAKACESMAQTKQPYVFFVRKDTVGSYENIVEKGPYPLARIDAIRILSEAFEPKDMIVATTGMTSRELFSLSDQPNFFYMQGSMGHASGLGLGIALTRPDLKVFVLDGDGALLMHMGALSTIGHYKPDNLIHFVLDNEAYETTGNQDTTSPSTDFCLAAKSSGYREALQVEDEASLRQFLSTVRRKQGPVLLRIKINRTPAGKVPRISSKHSSPQITERFQKSLKGV